MYIPKARKLPSGKWNIQIQVNGEKLSITEDTKKQAEARAAAIKSGVEHARKAPRTTLRQMLDAYIDEHSNVLSPTTITGYRAIQRTRFRPYMDRPAGKVNWQEAVNAEAALCSPKTLKNAWGLCSTAMKSNGISTAVRLPTVQKTPMPWLTPEQIPRFLEAIEGRPCEIPALLGLCSLRRSEIFGLEWSAVDLVHDILTVCNSVVVTEHGVQQKPTTKTQGSMRTVPIMIPRLHDLLDSVEDKTGYVCTCNPGTPYKQINRICQVIGLPEIGMHGLRRSFASLGYHLGLSELEIMHIGGWDDFQTVHKFYLYLSEHDRISSANKVTDFFKKFE